MRVSHCVGGAPLRTTSGGTEAGSCPGGSFLDQEAVGRGRAAGTPRGSGSGCASTGAAGGRAE
eukprot:10229685-Lingulodinium_polyedra.AAC.1